MWTRTWSISATPCWWAWSVIKQVSSRPRTTCFHRKKPNSNYSREPSLSPSSTSAPSSSRTSRAAPRPQQDASRTTTRSKARQVSAVIITRLLLTSIRSSRIRCWRCCKNRRYSSSSIAWYAKRWLGVILAQLKCNRKASKPAITAFWESS